MAGGLSVILLNAGLLALSTKPVDEATPYGFLAAAFFAGFSVDQFLHRVRAIGETTYGTRPSRPDSQLDGRDTGTNNADAS
jgi:hypothetical protein